MSTTDITPEPEPTQVEFEATLTGDLTFETERSHGMRIWLGTNIGTVNGGQFGGSQLLVAGTSLCMYVRKDDKNVGTVRLDLGPIISAAVDAWSKALAEVPAQESPKG